MIKKLLLWRSSSLKKICRFGKFTSFGLCQCWLMTFCFITYVCFCVLLVVVHLARFVFWLLFTHEFIRLHSVFNTCSMTFLFSLFWNQKKQRLPTSSFLSLFLGTSDFTRQVSKSNIRDDCYSQLVMVLLEGKKKKVDRLGEKRNNWSSENRKFYKLRTRVVCLQNQEHYHLQ